jgi:hypothetical protein
MNKNRIEGAAEQGERAMNCEALVIKARRRKSGGCGRGRSDILTAPTPILSWAMSLSGMGDFAMSGI